MYSDAYLSLGAHLVFGKVNPESLEPDWRAHRKSVDIVSNLGAALDEEPAAITNALERLAPKAAGYQRLRHALSQYRGREWEQLVSADAADAHKLRARFAEEGIAVTTDLSADVKRYQEQRGLPVTGIVATKTLAALNRSARQRLRTIAVNLERWRWLPDSFGDPHIVVNVPDFHLQFMQRDALTLRMNIIVGQRYRRTPVFSSVVHEVVLNPPWGVPRSIAIADKLPLIQRDSGYLAANKMKVFRGDKEVDPSGIDWRSLSKTRFPYQLRQDPGPRNALGRVKFNLKNDFSVYLHDTPDRHLFGRSDRGLSSGCIRVEQPIELAQAVLGQAWPVARIRRVIDAGKTVRIRVAQPVAVHLQYWTAWSNPNGDLHFRADLYERDERLARALGLPATP